MNSVAVINNLYTVWGISTVANAQFQVVSRKVQLAVWVNFESMTDVLRVSKLSIVPINPYILIPISQAASVPAGLLIQDQAKNRLTVKDGSGLLKYILLT